MMPVLLKMLANQFDVRTEPRPTPTPFVVKKASTATLVHMVGYFIGTQLGFMEDHQINQIENIIQCMGRQRKDDKEGKCCR